jgi:hypothetical protein
LGKPRSWSLEFLARRCSRGCWPRLNSTAGYRGRRTAATKNASTASYVQLNISSEAVA